MFTTVSKAGVGIYAIIIAQIIGLVAPSLSLDENVVADVIVATLNGAGAILFVLGHFMRKDLSFGFFRK